MNEINKKELCSYLIKQIDDIILDHILDNSPFNITIDGYIKITSQSRTWIIASDPVYQELCDYYKKHDDHSIVKSELTIPNLVYQYIGRTRLKFQEFEDRTRVCQYLCELSEELNQCMCNELISCDELDKYESFLKLIKLIKEKTKRFEKDRYPSGYNNHIKMIAYRVRLEFHFLGEDNTCNILSFNAASDGQVEEVAQDTQHIGKNYTSIIFIDVPFKSKLTTAFEFIRDRIKQIQQVLMRDKSDPEGQKATEEFDSTGQVFEYLEKLFSSSIYQHYYKSISTAEANYNNGTKAAHIALGLSSTLATTLLPFYNYIINDK